MIEKIFGYLYHRIRGHKLEDDVALPPSVLLRFSTRKLRDLFRGVLSKWSYGSASGLHFRGARTSISNPRYFHVGNDVVLGNDVTVEAFGREGVRLGPAVTIAAGSNLAATAVIREPGVGISVDEGTSIGRSNIIWGQGGVLIGAHCLLGPNVTVLSENHEFSDTNALIKSQGHVRRSVRIGDNCWIGAGAKILAGVTLGQGTVVAAGAVVTKSFGPYSVIGGVPAKLIRLRHAESTEPADATIASIQ